MHKFVPRERKKRRLAKQQSTNKHGASNNDGNVEIIIPETASEREDRRRRLKAELQAQQPESKTSSRKRKRLDHYIDTKLKREENNELLRKLAKQKVDTHLLQSSKTLGRTNETKREALRRALQEQAAGIDVDGDHDQILYQERREVQAPVLNGAEHAQITSIFDESQANGIYSPKKTTSSTLNGLASAAPSLFGSGLKRPLGQQEDGQPVIKRRKRRSRTDRRINVIPRGVGQEDSSENESSDDESSDFKTLVWTGFSGDEDEGESSDDHSDPEEPDLTSDDGDGDTESSAEEEDEDNGSEAEDESVVSDTVTKARTSSFKQWAQNQRNEALGFTPSTVISQEPQITAQFRPRLPSPDPLAETILTKPTTKSSMTRVTITVERDQAIQDARLALPVVQEEQRIMEAINNHPVVIICGETGSGKTTQVPQMMFENGYGSHCGMKKSSTLDTTTGLIGVTQPRRVAAVSVAERVTAELGDAYKTRVAHQVRYDTTASPSTAIKFMTDGILLREINQDFILSKYSAIVIDEAHERSVNTDILIGTLSRIVALREDLTTEDPSKYYPLKLVVMSATLRVADFAQNDRLFHGQTPPIVQAEGRQYPVTVHFARKTKKDYVEELVNKVARGHRQLPPGTMLVFLTGQDEIKLAAKLLKEKIGNTAGTYSGAEVRETADHAPMELDDLDSRAKLRTSSLEGIDEDYDDFDDDDDDDEFDIDAEENDVTTIPIAQRSLTAYTLPLYAALPTSQQMRVFQSPPEGSRLIVLATNVAETSLTIPGVRYVFDCGRSKEKHYDHDTGIQKFEIDWISKASAAQRTGRAGRTMAGHCWRLYSSAVYEECFTEHTVPEILRTPIESTVLQLKAMGIDNVVNFPFPTPPERSQLQAAERLLKNLGALNENGRVTDHGSALMQYPLSPRFAKILLLGARNNIINHAIAVVAALAIGDLIVPELHLQQDSQDGQALHQSYTRAQALLTRWDDQSDAVKLLTAVAAHADASSPSDGTKLCQQLALREKAMTEVQQLRQQLTAIVRAQQRHSAALSQHKLPLATEQERKMLNQIIAAGFLDQVAIRADCLPTFQSYTKPKRAIEVPYRPLFPLPVQQDNTNLAAQEAQKNIYVHPSSVLARLSKDELPRYVVYSHLSQTASKTVDATETGLRTRMHPLTSIGIKALASLAQDTSLLELGKPIGKIEDLEAGKRRICSVGVTLRPPVDQRAGSAVEWPLGAWKVEQVRQSRGEWHTVKVLSR